MTRARDVANLIGSGNYSSTTFTATAGQTAFTISHTQGFIQVFMNGLLLDETVDYTSNGSAVTLTSGAAAGDEIEVVAYNTFSVGDALPKSGGAMTGDLTVDTNTFHVDAADNRVGVGTTSPNRLFSVSSSTTRTSGFEDIAEYITPSIGVGGSTSLNVGRANSNYDLGKMAFKYNGAGSTSNELGFGFYGADNLLKINGSGHVTMPNQPYGEAEGNNGGLLASFSSGSIINWLTANHTNGGMSFSNSGRFTVPVAGRYLVSALIYYYPSGSHTAYYSLEIKKNGSLEAFKIDDHVESVSGSIDRTVQMTTIVRCAANDYLELGWSSDINASFWRGADHNKFRVLLLN